MDDLSVHFPKPCTEPWESMAPQGCNRHCAQCDKIIIDLESLTFTDAESMLATSKEPCVRARIDANGCVALKPEPWRGARRMIVAAGVGAGLLASGIAAAATKSPEGVIAGKVDGVEWDTRATATGADGKTYSAKVKPSGRYKIKRVPPGIYSVTFSSSCNDPWSIENVVVDAGRATARDTTQESQCIVVGMLEVGKYEG